MGGLSLTLELPRDMTNPSQTQNKRKTLQRPKNNQTNKQTKCDDNLTTPRTNPYNETPKKYIKELLGPVQVCSLV
jgi:hypothetical protein